RMSCRRGETTNPYGKCYGGYGTLLCCVPDPPRSSCLRRGSTCGRRGNGVCRLNCQYNEKVCKASHCDGVNCKCCKPNPPRSSCLRPGSTCGRRGNGVCRLNCQYNEKVCKASHCDGINCKCCKPNPPPPSCLRPGSPCGRRGKRDNGICRTDCRYNEKVCKASHCDGVNCKCCKPNPPPPSCLEPGSPCGRRGKRDNGICRTDCRYNEKVCKASHCDGVNCKCCKPNPPPPSCLEPGSPCGRRGKRDNGICRTDCRYNEKVCKASHCEGINCKCCKP
ncbi:unnamed protein product, partial [Meganyctiphanes norvegica]